MRGEVLHYNQAEGFGFITGADGNRYAFAREDMRQAATMGKGTQVEFTPSGGQARDVFAIHAPIERPAAPIPQAGRSVPRFGRSGATDSMSPLTGYAPAPTPSYASDSGASTGLWSYFRQAITTHYVNFRGRARRKEYWGYVLFWLIAVTALAIAGFAVDAATGNLDAGMGEPVIGFALPGLFVVATLLPGLAVTIRRIHDLGLSGWFYLLILLPYVGGLIIFVFTLIPSQKHENRWGPVPAGVRIPTPYAPTA
ncbi:DUF805 domain-containing protein [Mesorhizobium sp. CC13]|uniref:DUF805 domain-containing protein n=1 Tax=Mesorhizobium sp. CC13 TaxID=3029194 RepID=UPI003263F959